MKSRRIAATLIGWIAVLSYVSCYVHISHPPSSGSCKKNLQNSFLIKQIDLLFPNDKPGKQAGAPLSSAQLHETSSRYRSILKKLEKAHAQLSSDLTAYFEQSVPQQMNVKLKVTNSELEAGTVGTAEQCEIRVHIDVFRANFAAAVQDKTQASLRKSKEQLWADLVIFRHDTAKLPAGNWVGDWRKWDKEDRLDKCMDAVVQSEEWNSDYIGALAFLFAHEMGHIALGHLARDPSECQEFQRRELEADEYAGYFIGMVFTSTISVNDQTFTIGSVSPEVFLDKSIPMAGFKAGMDKCDYPDSVQRKGALFFGQDQARIKNNTQSGAEEFVAKRATYDSLVERAYLRARETAKLDKEKQIFGGRESYLDDTASLAAFASFLDPNRPEAYVVRGLTLLLLKKNSDAEPFLQNGLQLAKIQDRTVIEEEIQRFRDVAAQTK